MLGQLLYQHERHLHAPEPVGYLLRVLEVLHLHRGPAPVQELPLEAGVCGASEPSVDLLRGLPDASGYVVLILSESVAVHVGVEDVRKELVEADIGVVGDYEIVCHIKTIP